MNKLVRENINFERGTDPKDSMGLGGLDAQKAVLEDLLARLDEAGIGSKFIGGRFDPEDPETDIVASLEVPTSQPNKLSYSIYREKNNGKWEYAIYYNIFSGWETKSTPVFETSNQDNAFYFILQKAEEGYMDAIAKVDKTIDTFKKKREGFQNKVDRIQKYNEN